MKSACMFIFIFIIFLIFLIISCMFIFILRKSAWANSFFRTILMILRAGDESVDLSDESVELVTIPQS